MSLCLRGAADQGQTPKEIAAAEAATLDEGEKKQRYFKIAESLEDPLESDWSAVRGVGTFAPWTDSDLMWGRLVVWRPRGLTIEVGGQSTAVGHCAAVTATEWRVVSRWPSGEDAVRPLVLTICAENLGPDTLELTCRTIGGNVAATLQWPSDAPVKNLALAIVAAVDSSDFDCPIKPLRAWNLRLIGLDGTPINIAPESPSLAQQLGLEPNT